MLHTLRRYIYVILCEVFKVNINPEHLQIRNLILWGVRDRLLGTETVGGEASPHSVPSARDSEGEVFGLFGLGFCFVLFLF